MGLGLAQVLDPEPASHSPTTVLSALPCPEMPPFCLLPSKIPLPAWKGWHKVTHDGWIQHKEVGTNFLCWPFKVVSAWKCFVAHLQWCWAGACCAGPTPCSDCTLNVFLNHAMEGGIKATLIKNKCIICLPSFCKETTTQFLSLAKCDKASWVREIKCLWRFSIEGWSCMALNLFFSIQYLLHS